jgi:hypothetical protein
VSALRKFPRFAPMKSPITQVCRKYSQISLDPKTLGRYRLKLSQKNDGFKWRYKQNPPRRASVLLPLCIINGEPSILFTVS